MTLTVFGATGGTGLQVVEQGLVAGHAVRAVVRDATRLAPERAGLDVFVADVMDPAAIVEAVTGSDAIFFDDGTQSGGHDYGVRRQFPKHRRGDAQSWDATPRRRLRHGTVRRRRWAGHAQLHQADRQAFPKERLRGLRLPHC